MGPGVLRPPAGGDDVSGIDDPYDGGVPRWGELGHPLAGITQDQVNGLAMVQHKLIIAPLLPIAVVFLRDSRAA